MSAEEHVEEATMAQRYDAMSTGEPPVWHAMSAEEAAAAIVSEGPSIFRDAFVRARSVIV